MIKVILTDWNGVLTGDLYEIGFFSNLLWYLFFKRNRSIHFLKDIVLLHKKARNVVRCSSDANQNINDRNLQQLITKFNLCTDRYLTPDELRNFMFHYAGKGNRQLNHELIKYLSDLQRCLGIKVGIVSSGCHLNITNTLIKVGMQPDIIHANQFELKGSQSLKYEFKLFKNKHIFISQIGQLLGIDLSQFAFIGDDSEDLGCFSIVGYPVWFSVNQRTLDSDLSRIPRLYIARNNHDLLTFLNQNIT